MALIDPSATFTIPHPTEEGISFTFRPLLAGDSARISETQGRSEYAVTVRMIAAALVEWSYDVPISEANVARLDTPTYKFLIENVDLDGTRAPDEKKDLSNVSLAPSSRRNGRGALATLPS